MKNIREIKIGIITTFALGLIIWGINFLKGRDLFNTERTFYAKYSEVNGLSTSNLIYFRGIKIGMISDIKFHPNDHTQIIVQLSINNDIPIPNNSIAKIYSEDLMGTKAIEIKFGNSKIPAVNNDTLLSDIQASLQEEVSVQMLPIKEKAESLMSSLDSVIAVVQYIFNENTQKNLTKSFESIKITIKNLENTSFSIDTLIGNNKNRFERIFQDIESISRNIKNNNENLTNIMENFSSISDSLARTNIATTLLEAEKGITTFNNIITKIDNGTGSIGLLVNNDSLYNNLEAASRHMDELIDDLKLNPHRYVRFSIFGGGKKEYDPSKETKKQKKDKK